MTRLREPGQTRDRRAGYVNAVAEQLGAVQNQLNHHADRIEEEPSPRRAMRIAAGSAGYASDLLTHLARHDDPRASVMQRAHAEAELARMIEPDPMPMPMEPTERGVAAGKDVVGWLDQLIAPWPADHKVGMVGATFKGPISGGTAVDVEMYPATGSITLPVGALMMALRAVADQGGPAAETIRRVLIDHGVPAAAAYRAREDAFMANLDTGR